MSRPGLLRSLRDLFREFRNFGNPELENLKVHALRLQQELDELEARRAAREAQEEALALMQAQHTVHSLEQMGKIVQQSEKVIAAAVERAGAQTDQQIKALLQQKAEEVMSKIDLSKALSLSSSPEEAVTQAMEEASAQLQAEGANFRLAQAEPQAPPSSNMQSAQPASSPGEPNKQVPNKQVPNAWQHHQKRQMHQHSFYRTPMNSYSSWTRLASGQQTQERSILPQTSYDSYASCCKPSAAGKR